MIIFRMNFYFFKDKNISMIWLLFQFILFLINYESKNLNHTNIIYDNNIYEYLFNRYHVHYWLKLKFDILLWYIDLHSIVSIYYIYSISVLLYCLKDIDPAMYYKKTIFLFDIK